MFTKDVILLINWIKSRRNLPACDVIPAALWLVQAQSASWVISSFGWFSWKNCACL